MADPFLVQAIESGGSTPLNAEAAAIWEQALAKARGQLANLLNYPNRDTLFADVFGRAGTDSATFAANLQVLLAALGGEGLRIAVDLRSDDELAGAFAAYAASGHTGLERIYVNADKLNNGLLDVNLATSALLEEFGHALDWRLNGGADSPGDEGQLFAAEVSGVVLTAEQRAVIDAEDDTAVLTIEGVQVWVEQAAIVISSNMNWSAITGGSGTNGAPTTADTITINAGVTLTVDVLSAVSGALTNNGTLAVGNGNAVFLGSLAAAGGVSLGNASSALTVGTASTSTTYSGVISGAGTVRKTGTGIWTVSGASTYTGATTVSAGTLKLGAAGDGTNSPLGTVAGSTSFTSGWVLDLNGYSLGTAEPLTIRGTGIAGGGALTNSHWTTATYSGLLTLGAASTVKASSGDIILSNTGNITGSGFTLTLDGSATGSSMASALATGTGGLTKFGTGTWTVSGASSYSGVTTVSSGTLDVSGAAGALTATSAVEIYGGTLLLSGSAADRISNSASIYLDGDTDSQLQLSGAITETLGSLTLAGAGARVIDFGSGSGVLTLASLTAASPLSLQIWNWSGTTGSGGGTDQLIISSGSLGGSLSTTDISFYSDSGTTLLSSAAVIDADSDELVPVVCFLAGTLIATPTGEQPIETLQPGDLINTAEGPRPVRFLARSTRSIDQLEDLGKMPIRINQAALGALGPAQDTFLSPSHAVHYAGSLVEAAALINGTSIQQLYDWPEASLTYYNIELERHGLITANGLLVESYFGNYRNNGFSRDCWDNYHDFVARYGAGESMVELPLPRIPFARQIPMELRLSLQLHQDQYKAANPAIAASAVGQFAGLCL